MSKFLKPILIVLGFALLASAPAYAQKLDIGREATSAEIKGWDIDVRPDGLGLPEGKGTVTQGEELFQEKCSVCHGEFGEGVDRWPVLAGGQETLTSDRPLKTVGSYWPYLSTAYDYIFRAMPFGNAQSLSPDEVYALLAYLLNMNDLVDEDFELSKSNFLTVRLPNEKKFVDDPRPDTPTLQQKKPCMKNCKVTVEITNRARIVDVTPEGDKKSPEAAQ